MSGIVDARFGRIAAKLRLDSTSAEYGFAYALWSELSAAAGPGETGAPAESTKARVEEAIVWRLLAWRALAQFGGERLFEKRDQGAAAGTSVTHPAVDALAKIYERLSRSMSDVTGNREKSRDGGAKGLPGLMQPILEEAEVVFDELLGPGGFPGRASTNGHDGGTGPAK